MPLIYKYNGSMDENLNNFIMNENLNMIISCWALLMSIINYNNYEVMIICVTVFLESFSCAASP